MSIPRIGLTTSYQDPNDIVQYIKQLYIDAVKLAGGEPTALDFDTPLSEIDALVSGLDGVMYIGGWDIEPSIYGEPREPECGAAYIKKDLFEIALHNAARARLMPIFGICRGVQTINVAEGGTLYQDIPSRFGALHQQEDGNVFWHETTIEKGTLLHRILGVDKLMTNSYHHQSAARIGARLRACAWSTPGVVEAVEDDAYPFLLGVQWHPERTVGKDAYSIKLFEAFIDAAKKNL